MTQPKRQNRLGCFVSLSSFFFGNEERHGLLHVALTYRLEERGTLSWACSEHGM
jgi:hypothetical protein